MLTFYYAPWSRASSILWLLEELGVPYERVHVDIRAKGGVDEDYRSIQPNKKVPAVVHDGTVITERAAITIHLTDIFGDVGLAPQIGTAERARYLTTIVYADSVLDPCISARAHGLAYGSNDYSFGRFDDMVLYLERLLTERDFAAGDRFSAADTQLASAIDFTMNTMPVLPRRPPFEAYLSRMVERPAYQRAKAIDYEEAMKLPFFRERAAPTP